MDIEIRNAHPGDADALSDLAFRAKSHWGYPVEWMELWRPDLTLTAEYLGAHPGFVAVIAEAPVGFCALEAAADGGAVRVTVLFDPFAEAFYQRLGARRVGAVPAPMPQAPERVLPQLEFALRGPSGTLRSTPDRPDRLSSLS